MEFKQLIQERRSVRRYVPGQVIAREVLEDMIADTLLAPSWKNTQTGRYYIVCEPEKVAAFREAALPDFNQARSRDASAYIVCTYRKGLSGYGTDKPADELGETWGAYDLGLQNAYLLLSAREHGLDTLIMGLRNADAIRSLLSIPADEVIMPVISLGLRDGEPVFKERKEVAEVANFF